MEGDQVIGTVELGWEGRKFAIALEPIDLKGWDISVAVPIDAADYSAFLRHIFRSVSGDAA